MREDRLRQGGSSANKANESDDDDDLEKQLLAVVASNTDLDSKGRKIVLKTTQTDLLKRLQQLKAAKESSTALAGSSRATETPFLSTNREGVVQSRLVRFTGPNGHAQRPNGSMTAAATPNTAAAAAASSSDLNQSNHVAHSKTQGEPHEGTTNNIERLVFGISPKSSSLSR